MIMVALQMKNINYMYMTPWLVLHAANNLQANTSREHTFDPRLKWALVSAFFAPGTRETFSPGWWLQPRLKVPAQRLLRQAVVAGDL